MKPKPRGGMSRLERLASDLTRAQELANGLRTALRLRRLHRRALKGTQNRRRAGQGRCKAFASCCFTRNSSVVPDVARDLRATPSNAKDKVTLAQGENDQDAGSIEAPRKKGWSEIEGNKVLSPTDSSIKERKTNAISPRSRVRSVGAYDLTGIPAHFNPPEGTQPPVSSPRSATRRRLSTMVVGDVLGAATASVCGLSPTEESSSKNLASPRSATRRHLSTMVVSDALRTATASVCGLSSAIPPISLLSGSLNSPKYTPITAAVSTSPDLTTSSVMGKGLSPARLELTIFDRTMNDKIKELYPNGPLVKDMRLIFPEALHVFVKHFKKKRLVPPLQLPVLFCAFCTISAQSVVIRAEPALHTLVPENTNDVTDILSLGIRLTAYHNELDQFYTLTLNGSDIKYLFQDHMWLCNTRNIRACVEILVSSLVFVDSETTVSENTSLSPHEVTHNIQSADYKTACRVAATAIAFDVIDDAMTSVCR